MKTMFLFSCLFCSSTLLADVRFYAVPEWELSPGWRFTPTLSYEANALGHFTNFGLKWGGNRQPGSHVELVSNLSFFTGENNRSNDISFTNFDTSIRFGVFERFNLYAELGIALDELIADSDNYPHEYEDSYYYGYNGQYRNSSRPDWFAGVGAGWQMSWLTVNVFARYRYLESLEEQYLQKVSNRYQTVPDRYQWFSGVELSIQF